MKSFSVVFYYKDSPAYKGNFDVEADNEEIARKLVKIMIETKSGLIPGNWDRYEVKNYD
jgi:hypothetical protein